MYVYCEGARLGALCLRIRLQDVLEEREREKKKVVGADLSSLTPTTQKRASSALQNVDGQFLH